VEAVHPNAAEKYIHEIIDTWRVVSFSPARYAAVMYANVKDKKIVKLLIPLAA
jgi:hypothetical protein